MSSILDITSDVKWIGALDKDIVTFDIVMETQYGTTYNSYFIDAEKKAIIDTAKETFKDEYLSKVKEVVNPAEIEVIVINHTEPDHSGNLPHLLEIAPNATVYGSRQALAYLQDMMNCDFPSVVVKDGDEISLGNKTLKIIGAPNLHWPDSIYTYLQEDGILFTCDSFGAHYCDHKMFDDQVPNYDDAFTYYFDVILKPYSNFMLKAIEKISDLPITTICPGHGPILRSSWKEKVAKSKELSDAYLNSLSEKSTILVTYISAYGYTKEMAEIIAKSINEAGDFHVKLLDIETASLPELEEQITHASGILVGTPTINKNTLLPVYQMLAVINPLRDKKKKAAAFGSYGWSGEAIGLVESALKNLGLDIVVDGMRMKFQAGSTKTAQLEQFGKEYAAKFMAE